MTPGARILVAGQPGPEGEDVAQDTAEIWALAESLAEQTHGKALVLISDSGSSYGAAERLAEVCRRDVFDLVLVPHSLWGADIAPRLAGLLDRPCATACSNLQATGDGWVFSRRLHGGALTGKYRTGRGLCVISLETSRPAGGSPTGTTLQTADRVVAGGRGMGGPEGFERLAALAESLGAALASSRPPCDAGWVPSSLQVGITGAHVKPDLYLAVGISGSVQHLAGMHRAGCIAAINRDPDAPIFRYAHLGVVGDWHDVVDGMLEELPCGQGVGRC